MAKLSDIRILICNQEPEYLTLVHKSLINIGLKKIFIASSQAELKQICDGNQIDIALIDTNFNGTGGFITGKLLINQFPDIFLIYITEPKQIMDPIKSIFSEAVAFIIKDNSTELIKKVTLWVEVVRNSLKRRRISMANQAPEKYTPEYCSAVYERLKMAVDAAVKALTLANQAQRDLTTQTVKHLQETFDDIKEEIHIQNIKNEKLNKKTSDLKLQFYAAGITSLIFLMGFAFSILTIAKSLK